MQALQPEMKELQAKYSSKDQATQQKLQQETMALFQKYNVNPLAGCLPIVVQMPILIGVYHAISRTKEIAGDSFLWFDLGSPDPYYILPIISRDYNIYSAKNLDGRNEFKSTNAGTNDDDVVYYANYDCYICT